MTAAAALTALASSVKQSTAAPLLAGVVASGSILSEQETGMAVLICLGGGAFLLSIVVNVLKVRNYSKGDRTVEAKAQTAELVTRAEVDQKLKEVWDAVHHMRDNVTKDLKNLASDVAAGTADMQNALGRLQGLWEANTRKSPPR